MNHIKSKFYDAQGRLIGEDYYTPGELEQAQAEANYQEALAVSLQNRRLAYAQQWPEAFDVFDDMTKRGVEAVLADRLAIKEKYPKPVRG